MNVTECAVRECTNETLYYAAGGVFIGSKWYCPDHKPHS